MATGDIADLEVDPDLVSPSKNQTLMDQLVG